jgi:Ala-tRNA(Pro) deacylase
MYVTDFLGSRGVWFETLLHRPAASATKLAGSVHIPGHKVFKTVLVRTGGGFVLAVLPSTKRIVLDRLAEVLQVDPVQIRLATDADLYRVFQDCEPGSVPPFGHLYGLRTVIEECLSEEVEIVFGTNIRHQGLRMRFLDYEAIEAPLRASFADPVARCADCPGSETRHRRAG